MSPARGTYAVVDRALSCAVALVMVASMLSPSLARAAESRYAAIVVDAESGTVLSATNPDRRSFPASLTKVMTLYLLFDALEQGRLGLQTMLPVSAHAAAQAPSKLGLRPGDRISVEDVILALVTKSANDAAVVAAEALGGSEAYFALTMSRKAHALGMTQTVYRNASGLPNPGQVSSPRDQAILARAMIRHHPKYYGYFSTREFDWRGQTISTHNRLMLNYPGADGMKTGYINASGFNLIASAVRDGRRLVGVVFGGNTASWRDHRMAQLLDNGFAHTSGGDETRTAAADESEDTTPPKPSIRPVRNDVGMGDSEPVNWTIQVGAYNGYKPARHAAAAAAQKLGALVARATIAVEKAKSGHQVLYRARLTGFTEDQARAACHRLSKSRHECHVVTPST